MKIALDPYMFRTTPLPELPALVARLGYRYIELSPREDFIPFFRHPRVDTATVRAFKDALREAQVELASVLPLFRWSGPDEDERQAAGALLEAIHRDRGRARGRGHELGVQRPTRGRVDLARRSSGARWRSSCRSSSVRVVHLALEPHPDDFIEDGLAAVDLVRGIDSPNVSFLYCAPHTFHQGGNMAEIMRSAGDLLTQVHVADGFDHRASSGLRYITNPPGNTVRVHQHLDIGQGEVPWDTFFGTLEELRLRRHHDRLRVRLGGASRGVEPPQPGRDRAPHGGLAHPRIRR